MIGIAIDALKLLIGAIALCGVIWLVIYGLKTYTPLDIPARLEQGLWFIVLLLIIIGVLTLIGGGTVGGIGFHRAPG